LFETVLFEQQAAIIIIFEVLAHGASELAAAVFTIIFRAIQTSKPHK